MSNLEKAKRLIKEGYTTVQDNLMDAMLSVKKTNPNLSHNEVMSILQGEFDRFIKRHSDRMDLPKKPSEELGSGKILRDKMPLRSIPYGSKRKKGL